MHLLGIFTCRFGTGVSIYGARMLYMGSNQDKLQYKFIVTREHVRTPHIQLQDSCVGGEIYGDRCVLLI